MVSVFTHYVYEHHKGFFGASSLVETGASSNSRSPESRPEEKKLVPAAVHKAANETINELCSVAHLFLRDELQMPSFS